MNALMHMRLLGKGNRDVGGNLDNSQLVMISKINGESLHCSIMPVSTIHPALLNACYVKDPGIQSQVDEINSHKKSNHEYS